MRKPDCQATKTWEMYHQRAQTLSGLNSVVCQKGEKSAFLSVFGGFLYHKIMKKDEYMLAEKVQDKWSYNRQQRTGHTISLCILDDLKKCDTYEVSL